MPGGADLAGLGAAVADTVGHTRCRRGRSVDGAFDIVDHSSHDFERDDVILVRDALMDLGSQSGYQLFDSTLSGPADVSQPKSSGVIRLDPCSMQQLVDSTRHLVGTLRDICQLSRNVLAGQTVTDVHTGEHPPLRLCHVESCHHVTEAIDDSPVHGTALVADGLRGERILRDGRIRGRGHMTRIHISPASQ